MVILMTLETRNLSQLNQPNRIPLRPKTKLLWQIIRRPSIIRHRNLQKIRTRHSRWHSWLIGQNHQITKVRILMTWPVRSSPIATAWQRGVQLREESHVMEKA
eukprot:690554-Karenia_brevis.AAC.1